MQKEGWKISGFVESQIEYHMYIHSKGLIIWRTDACFEKPDTKVLQKLVQRPLYSSNSETEGGVSESDMYLESLDSENDRIDIDKVIAPQFLTPLFPGHFSNQQEGNNKESRK